MSKRSVEKRLQRKREMEKAQRRRAKRVRQVRMWVSAAIALLAVILILIFATGKKTTKATATSTPTASASASAGVPCTGPTPPAAHPKTYKQYPPTVVKQTKKYDVTMETSCGTIHMTLDPKLAPKAVNNFVYLAQQGFYNGLTFHRIEENAPFQLVQGGDPKGDGSGTPGYQFTIEKPTPSATDPYVQSRAGATYYLKGVIAMANSGGAASNGSQFFIDASDVQLEPNYTVLGKADTASLAVLQKMIAVPVAGTSPNPKVYIINVTVEETA